MDFAIDEDASVLLAAVADFFKRRDDERTIASAAATGRAADRARWSALCELGLPAFRVADPIGMGAGLLEATALAEHVGAVLLPEPAMTSVVLSKLWAEHGGSAWLRDALLDGSSVVQFAPFNRVQLSGTVNGALTLFDDGITDLVAAPAASEDAVAVVILARDEFSPSMQDHDVDPSRPTARYELDGLQPIEVLPVDEAAIDTARHHVTILMAGELVGAMQAVLTATIRYVRERQQFGRSLGSFQAVKHQLADMYVAVEQARAAVQFAAVGCDREAEGVPADVAAAARWVSRSAIDVFDKAIHLHGAMGYSWEMYLHLHLRRALATRELLTSWGVTS